MKDEPDFAGRDKGNVIPKRKMVAENEVCQNRAIDQSSNEQEKRTVTLNWAPSSHTRYNTYVTKKLPSPSQQGKSVENRLVASKVAETSKPTQSQVCVITAICR